MRLPLLRSALALAIFALTAVRADAQTVYVVGSDNSFGSIDFTTGTYTQVSGLSGSYQGLAYNAGSNNFFSVNSANELVRISTAGVVSPAIGNTGTAIRGVALNSGTLYGFDVTNNNIVTIDTTSGATTNVGSGTGITSVSSTTPAGLTFVGSTLYSGVQTASSALYSFDAGTGVATLKGNSSNPALYDTLVTFSDGTNLYGIAQFGVGASAGIKLFTIDSSNGSYSTKDVTGANLPTAFTGASFVPVPEPGSVLALGAAGAGVVGWLRRRRAA